MPFSWKVVGSTGYDVESIDHPRTHEMLCPSCETRARFVEKALVKNLRVFGVPLVGVEPAKRVFECPRCRVCVEPPEQEELAVTGDDAAVTALRERLARIDDDVWLWTGRAQAAEKHGDADLASEALRYKRKAEQERDRLQALLEGQHVSVRRDVRSLTKAGAIVSRAGSEPIERTTEGQFEALKRRLANQKAEPERGADPVREKTEEAPVVDAAQEFDALKSRLATRGSTDARGSEEDYVALKREMQTVAEPNHVQRDVPPAGRPAGSDEDDPVAALKQKLRRPKT